MFRESAKKGAADDDEEGDDGQENDGESRVERSKKKSLLEELASQAEIEDAMKSSNEAAVPLQMGDIVQVREKR